MEGFCRASSPPSIADSATRFNAKWPENRGFLYICVVHLRIHLPGNPTPWRPKYLSSEGLSAIARRESAEPFSGNSTGSPPARGGYTSSRTPHAIPPPA